MRGEKCRGWLMVQQRVSFPVKRHPRVRSRVRGCGEWSVFIHKLRLESLRHSHFQFHFHSSIQSYWLSLSFLNTISYFNPVFCLRQTAAALRTVWPVIRISRTGCTLAALGSTSKTLSRSIQRQWPERRETAEKWTLCNVRKTEKLRAFWGSGFSLKIRKAEGVCGIIHDWRGFVQACLGTKWAAGNSDHPCV